MTDRQKKRALVMAASGNLVGVVARLLDMGVPVDGFDEGETRRGLRRCTWRRCLDMRNWPVC